MVSSSSNYEILRKANLVDDLFVRDADDAAAEQEEADRDWAGDLEQNAVGEVEQAVPAEAPDASEASEPPAATVETPPATSEIVLHEEGAATEVESALPPALLEPAAPNRSWTQALAGVTGNANLESVRCLGLCALNRETGSSDAASALAQWMAQSASGPTLLVEAHFGDPRLGLRFDGGEAGITDVLRRSKSLDECIQDTGVGNLKLLAGGAKPGIFRQGRALTDFPSLLVTLRQRFESILLELPAVDDPSLQKLPLAAMADALILVADPKLAQPAALRRAAEQLQAAGAPLAAVMLSSKQTRPPASYREGLAQSDEISSEPEGLFESYRLEEG